MEVTIASEKDRNTWDEIVASSDHGTIFHTWNWLKVMEKHTLKKIGPWTARGRLYPMFLWQGQDIAGLMPFYIYNFNFFRLLCSPPFSVENFYLGPVITRYDTQKSARRQLKVQKFQEAVDTHVFEALQPHYISIHSAPFFTDPRPFMWGGYTVTPEFTNIIYLQDNLEAIRDRFSHSARKTLNKQNSGGVKIVNGSRTDVEFIHSRLEKGGRIHATKEFVLDIFENFHQTNLEVMMIKKDEMTLGGIICLHFNNRASIWLGPSKVPEIIPSPNYLLHWEAIRWAHEKGFAYLELIGAYDLQTFSFKRQFGGDIVPFYSVKWYHPVLRKIRGLFA